MRRVKLLPYHHEKKLARRAGYANSNGGRMSETHAGILVFADPDSCSFAHRPTSVLIPWATIRAALRRKEQHEVRGVLRPTETERRAKGV